MLCIRLTASVRLRSLIQFIVHKFSDTNPNKFDDCKNLKVRIHAVYPRIPILIGNDIEKIKIMAQECECFYCFNMVQSC